MIIAASPPGLPRRSITNPSALRKSIDRLLKRAVHRRHPDVESDDPALLSRRACACSADDDTRTYIVGRLPTVTASPCSGDRRMRLRHGRAVAIEKRDLDRRIGAPRSRDTLLRQASSCASRAAGHRAIADQQRRHRRRADPLHDPARAYAGRGRAAGRIDRGDDELLRSAGRRVRARRSGRRDRRACRARTGSRRNARVRDGRACRRARVRNSPGVRGRDGLRPQLVADRVPAARRRTPDRSDGRGRSTRRRRTSRPRRAPARAHDRRCRQRPPATIAGAAHRNCHLISALIGSRQLEDRRRDIVVFDRVERQLLLHAHHLLHHRRGLQHVAELLVVRLRRWSW